jgi:predicted nucleotidyltransferase
VIDSKPLKEAFNQLVEKKRSGHELDRGPRVPVISDFLDRELARMEQVGFERRAGACSADELDGLFHSVLVEVWSETTSTVQL